MDFIPADFLDIIIRLLLAAILSGLIGIERESKQQPAGLRTHVLVGTGSCLMMILSITGFDMFLSQDSDVIRFDPGRIPSYVISGIGFLGAGTIIVQKGSVKGLTTAASIWVAAGLGLVIGIDMYFVGILTTAIVLITLHFLEKVERKYLSIYKQKTIVIVAEDRENAYDMISGFFEESEVEVIGFQIENEELYSEKNASKYTFTINGGNIKNESELIKKLQKSTIIYKVIV
ncbi:MgtC/SapB family protein [Planococcus sp. YIM B11945]|uniref:MgtC/SapB family protein n=1 Tax=Planococcus sp. YIM B11945 TaxID=3435410 RepID=UPI003D7D73EB